MGLGRIHDPFPSRTAGRSSTRDAQNDYDQRKRRSKRPVAAASLAIRQGHEFTSASPVARRHNRLAPRILKSYRDTLARAALRRRDHRPDSWRQSGATARNSREHQRSNDRSTAFTGGDSMQQSGRAASLRADAKSSIVKTRS